MWGVNIVTQSIVGISSFSAYFYYYHLFFFVEMTLTPIWILAINVCLCSCLPVLLELVLVLVDVTPSPTCGLHFFQFLIFDLQVGITATAERTYDWLTDWLAERVSEWIVSLDFNNWQFGWLCPSRFMSMSTHICLSDCLTACLTVS